MDKTREICIDYAKRFPDIIKLHLNSHNKGVLKNYFDCFAACSGKYIADCAGDDFGLTQINYSSRLIFWKKTIAYLRSIQTGTFIILKAIRKSYLIQEAISVHSGNPGFQAKNYSFQFLRRKRFLLYTPALPYSALTY